MEILEKYLEKIKKDNEPTSILSHQKINFLFNIYFKYIINIIEIKKIEII